MPASPDPELTRTLEESAERIFRFCLHLTGGRRADAEDLAQETLLAGFRALPGFLKRAQLSTYLHTIAVHAWRRRAQKPDSQDVAFEERHARSVDPIPIHLYRLSLDSAVDALSEPLREAFLLVKVQQLTHREAAAALGVPVGTVQSRVHDAVHQLRKSLSEEFMK
jgi:RNA polymerase sigma-70 factor, ECF subfamily